MEVLPEHGERAAAVEVDEVVVDRAEVDDRADLAVGAAPASPAPSVTSRIFSGRMLKVPSRPTMLRASAPVSRLEVPTKPATNGLAGAS